jgi:hypothetical protein
MERASRAPAYTTSLFIHRPGFDNIRNNLYLASTREITLAEDVEYSWLGIFFVRLTVIKPKGGQGNDNLTAFPQLTFPGPNGNSSHTSNIDTLGSNSTWHLSPVTVRDVVLRFGGLTTHPLAIRTVVRRPGPEMRHDRGVAFFDKRARRAFDELSSGEPNANGIGSIGGRT